MAYSDCTTKTAQIAFIRGELGHNQAWALKGLVTIYQYQTDAEKAIGNTVEHNGVGFNGADGEILSSFAEQVKSGRTMSVKQMGLIYKKMPKYAKQLQTLSK